ncbi:(6-4) photolyase [Vibrio hippocampi]|uniref:(6-4) photolyase n=2 Tax=Vibrio hippocampi TaxID=654686 RepID=A0ABM8ZNP3_9VIBR|nr:(6-4) photolyase [Vibrio hippocampi]
MEKHIETLRFVFGDQLNAQHSWFETVDSSVMYIVAEMHQEVTYTTHHIQKVAAFFLAMRRFAQERQNEGHNVLLLTLDDTANFTDFSGLVTHLVDEYQPFKVEFQRPDEYRLFMKVLDLTLADIEIELVDSEHFFLDYQQIEKYFPHGKHVKMEFFYRHMRRQTGFLMQQDQPQGGRWNYDANNRNKLTKSAIAKIPMALLFSHDITDIKQRLDTHGVQTIGEAEGDLIWPTSREEGMLLLAHFCEQCLPNFGRYQDAMTENSLDSWTLYHSRLSFSLNCKLIQPIEVIEAAIAAYQENPAIDLSQIEGFVRQILGWREYIRGMYWANMPEYKTLNALVAERNLPEFFWTGDTKMSCMKAAIGQSLKYAYAHHIQRLMVTGNFCLLAGIAPDEVDAWYLGIYIDAIEWVEMPNTRGMALFSDGGMVATKPYAASGAYINKMSDHCKGCHYDVKQKVGCDACPFNSLYWNFMVKHRQRIGVNPRVGMIYRYWDGLEDSQQSEILAQAQSVLSNIEAL